MPVKLRKILKYIPVYHPGGTPDECGAATAVKLSSNESPWEPPAEVVEAITQAAHTLNRYPDFYEEELCAKLAEFYGVEPSQIAVDNGSGTIIQDLVRAVCDDGDEVLYCTPSFAAYDIDVMLAGAVPVKVPLDGQYRYDLDGMLAAVTPKTRMAIICNPNNPTGTYRTAAEIARFVDRLPSDILVVVDEAYHEFERREPLEASLELVRQYDNVVLMRTFSKAFGLAGMRIGYCITRDYLVDAVNQAVAEFSVSSPAQAAAIKILEHQVYRQVAERTAQLVSVRERFEKGLAAAGIEFIPSSSNFVMLPMDPVQGFAKMEDAGFIVRPFDNPRGIRITMGTEEQMQGVCRALGFELPEA
ncbi:MAG: histidinol-phosphate transaminase [Coriobacteriales bacterium]